MTEACEDDPDDHAAPAPGEPRSAPRDATASALASHDADDALTRGAFAAATFLGAFLLFLVQPLIARFILPWFGGGPAVWTTCVPFFQVVLLAGYAYAHLGVKRLPPRAQAAVHVSLTIAATLAAFVLTRVPLWQPRAAAMGSESASELAPVLRILAVLTLTVSLPAFVLSATSPLLNAWYTRALPATGSRAYRLYAVSNAGSLLALLAYPFVIEPAWPRRTQAAVWTAGLALFAIVCGWCARSAAAATRDFTDDADAQRAKSPLRARLLWLALPACASVLLLATTNTLTHDVAPMPLLWVLPLVLYLLTFILAFDAPHRWYRRGAMAGALPLAAAGVCAVLLGADVLLSMSARVALLSAAMFACCLACHGELAALRPPTHEITAYYLTVAAGGAAGGLLVAIGAPLLLDRYAELHLGLWTTCALVFAAPLVARRGAAARRPSGLLAMAGVTGLVVLAAVLWQARDPYPFARGTPVGRWRDFYGVVTLYEAHRGDDELESVFIRHAGVTHGLQFRSPAKRNRPTAYFGETSGVGVALRDDATRARRVGVIGLGAGTVAAYGRPGDNFRFYELSPTVERVARERFTFLADSPANCEVVTGDGRLSLEREPPQEFDVLVLDAFTGHAIPIHLLTAEAFALYRRHLAPGGVITVHVSNRYVDLQPVVARHAADCGWTAIVISTPAGNDVDGLLEADWILMTDDAGRAEHFRRTGGVAPRRDPKVARWTDDYASIFRILR